MRVFLVLTLLSVCTAATGAPLAVGGGYGAAGAPRDVSPLALADMFCAAQVDGDIAPLEPYFAPKLSRLLASHGTQPVPWRGRPETPSHCTATIANGFDDTIGVLVYITYVDGGQPWTDTLNLERTPDSWWINNVFYDGGGNLRFRLVELQTH